MQAEVTNNVLRQYSSYSVIFAFNNDLAIVTIVDVVLGADGGRDRRVAGPLCRRGADRQTDDDRDENTGEDDAGDGHTQGSESQLTGSDRVRLDRLHCDHCRQR